MNQPRFVVEIARPVPAQAVGQAAGYIAARLGIDEARIRTLLGGRTGPVTRDVPADKADAIAKVFREAGVMVTIVERATVAPEPLARKPFARRPVEGLGEAAGTAPHDPQDPESDERAADYEYQGPPGIPADAPRWEVDDAWEADGDDDAVPWRVDEPAYERPHERPRERSPERTADHSADRLEDRPAAQPGVPLHARPDAGSRRAAPRDADALELESEQLQGAVDLRPSSTRWVPSPHEDPAGQPSDLGARPATDPGPDDVDEWPLSVPDDGPAPSEPNGAGAHDPFSLDEEDRRPGLWVAPDRSRFGDLESAPGERPRLRVYLLWALVASIVLLVVLQLVFSSGASAAAGSSYAAGLVPYRSGDFAAARRAWEGAAATGDPRAQYMLGYLVQNGLGQPWSNARAAEWYQRAAAQGLPEAQVALARLYLEGLGVEPDAAVGIGLLRAAAATGHPAALYQYAQLQLHGRWVEQDFEAALSSFAAAAAGGSADAADYVALADYLRMHAMSSLAGEPEGE